MSQPTIVEIKRAVCLPGEDLKKFREMWGQLTEKDKDDLRTWMAKEAQTTPSNS